MTVDPAASSLFDAQPGLQAALQQRGLLNQRAVPVGRVEGTSPATATTVQPSSAPLTPSSLASAPSPPNVTTPKLPPVLNATAGTVAIASPTPVPVVTEPRAKAPDSKVHDPPSQTPAAQSSETAKTAPSVTPLSTPSTDVKTPPNRVAPLHPDPIPPTAKASNLASATTASPDDKAPHTFESNSSLEAMRTDTSPLKRNRFSHPCQVLPRLRWWTCEQEAIHLRPYLPWAHRPPNWAHQGHRCTRAWRRRYPANLAHSFVTMRRPGHRHPSRQKTMDGETPPTNTAH